MTENQKVVLFQLGLAIVFAFMNAFSIHYPKYFIEGAATAYAFACIFFIIVGIIFTILK